MTLLSAEQDFELRTLAALASPLAKLAFCASLRDASGTYSHWGLTRAHTSENAERAIAAAHTRIFLEVLQTHLRTLVLAERQARNRADQDFQEFVSELRRDLNRLVPADCAGASAQHLSFVLEALSALEGERATRRAA